MTDIDRAYINKLAEDPAMCVAIVHYVEEYIEKKVYPLDMQYSNEMIGSLIRAERTGKRLIKDAVYAISGFRKVEEKKIINNAV